MKVITELIWVLWSSLLTENPCFLSGEIREILPDSQPIQPNFRKTRIRKSTTWNWKAGKSDGLLRVHLPFSVLTGKISLT